MPALSFSVLSAFAAISSADVQTWPLCFDEDGAPLPATYAAFREAGRMFREAGSFSADATLSSPPAGSRGWTEAELMAYVELLRAGVSPSYLTVEKGPTSAPGCLSVTVSLVPPASNPPMLWHLRGVYFDAGGAEVSSPDARAAVRIAATVYAPGETVVILDGHTDTVGTPAANLELSRQRTEALAEALVREGVRWEDIRMRWYGETRLARPTADETAEPLNRRVWIDVRGRAATPH